MKLFLDIALLISFLSAAASLKVVANNNGGESQPSLRTGSRRTEDSCDSIMDIICSLQNTKTFCKMVTEAAKEQKDFGDSLSGGKTFTVFAPTDEAFRVYEKELFKLTPDEIHRTILFHFYEDVVLTNSDLACQLKLTSITGETSRVKCVRKEVGVYTKYQRGKGNKNLDNWPLIDIKSKEACSGIIHRVDQVMLPVVFEPFEYLLPTVIPTKNPTASPTKTPTVGETAADETEAPTVGASTAASTTVSGEDATPTEVVTPTDTTPTTPTDTTPSPVDDPTPTPTISVTEVERKPRIGALGINLIIFSTLLLCFVFVCMRR